MQAILLVTVFSCLLGAANAADVALGATCTSGDTCTDPNAACSTSSATCVCKSGYTEYRGSCAITYGTAGGACLTSSPACTGDTLVCDSTVCKLKAGQTCTATSPCVSLSACSTTCTCNNGYSAASTGLCNSPSSCFAAFYRRIFCASNYENVDCVANGAVGAACLSGSTCTASTSVCESMVCKVKAGQACTAASDCVSPSVCSTTCGCNSGYSAGVTGLCTNGAVGSTCKADGSCTASTSVCESSMCKTKAGETCAATADCVSQSTCPTSTTKCACNSGYTQLATGLCNGVAPQSLSSWLFTGSIITFLVTLSLP